MRTPDQCGHLEINKCGESFSAALFINVTCFYSWRIWFKNFIEDEGKNFENSTILDIGNVKRFRKVFVMSGPTLGAPGGTFPPPPPPALHTHTPFLQTKIFFLVVLLRFTSWSWFVWITFSSVLTISQCLHSHVTSQQTFVLMKTSSRHLKDVLQRCLQDAFKMYHQVIMFLLISFQDVFKTYSQRLWGVLQRRLSTERFA